jgi:hypothetical protein
MSSDFWQPSARLFSALPLQVGEHACHVENRDDFDRLAPQPVDHAVGTDDQLAKG